VEQQKHLPPALGGSFGSQESPRNSRFGGQHGFRRGPLSGAYSSSNNGPIAFSGNRNGHFSEQKPSGSYNIPVAGGLSGGLSTHKASSFTGPSDAYLPPGSSFYDQKFSGSVGLVDPKPMGNGFRISPDGTSCSYDNPSNDATAIQSSLLSSANTYSPSGSRSYEPGVSHHEEFALTANSADCGPERNGSQRVIASYSVSRNGVVSGQTPDTHGFPSQGQLDISVFEGYKY
jgi:hypothetical protein